MRTKTYIAFDGDSDLMSYRTIQGWSADPVLPFTLNDAHDINYARDDSLPESIIKQLYERLEVSKQLLLIIGSSTNHNRKGILQYELRYALRNRLPIILVFKGYSSDTYSSDHLWYQNLLPLIPKTITEWGGEKYCLICPFSRATVISAIQSFTNINLPSEGFTWFWN